MAMCVAILETPFTRPIIVDIHSSKFLGPSSKCQGTSHKDMHPIL